MADETPTTDEAFAQAGVASPAENADLDHTEGGATTRDGLDAGVPMLPGDPAEPQGPEDALGAGPKRGDYTNRVDGNPLVARGVPDGGKPITAWTDDETGKPAKAGAKGATEHVVDYTPNAALEPQRPNATVRGDATALKGGVDTDPASPLQRVGTGAIAAPADTGNADGDPPAE